jgi:hypothetical protein
MNVLLNLLYFSNFTTVGAYIWTILGFVISIVAYISLSVNLKKIHNLGSDRIYVLENSSYQVEQCGDRATAIAVSLNNYHFGVTVAHFSCEKKCPKGFIDCKSLDASLDIRGCPPTKSILDASQFTDVKVGDEVYAYGFSTVTLVRNYRAVIGYEHGSFVNGSAFNHEAIVKPNYRHLIGGEQTSGFSGSCVLNGYGIVGLACANIYNSTNAVVVPWIDIFQCIQENMRDKNVIFPSNCSSTVVSPPTLYNFAEKKFIPWIKQNSYLKSTISWIYNNM